MYLSGRYQLGVKSYELRVIVETRHAAFPGVRAASPGRRAAGDGRPAGAEEHGRGGKKMLNFRYGTILF